MSHDDHVIPYEEAVRRHRALEAEKQKGVIHEVKISDAMVHLLEGEAVQQDEATDSGAPAAASSSASSPEEDERSGREPEERSDEVGPEDAPSCSLSDRPEQAQ